MNKNMKKISGWILLLLAVGLFLLQMGFLFLHAKFQVEYSDNRLFYLINIFSLVCLGLSILFLVPAAKKWEMAVGIAVAAVLIANGMLLVADLRKTKNIVSLSPNFKHVFSIKQNKKTGEATYYRTYYHLLALPKETLPYQTSGNFKVKWIANDAVAVTYQAADKTIHQYIGTYGDRGRGGSYYYVGPSIYGRWSGENAEVISNEEGIKVLQNGKVDAFSWDQTVQFGTLAVVLVNDGESVWTISLNENFSVQSDSSAPPRGDISLYKATMKKNKPVKLTYAGSV
ncbi:hypothetical protein [Siminovitchia sp. 179-K 8D1 HS]|uniref:hypothetical protein n=1 Tax=Siminovitchia sp. 179-K 8D1 HS TaxID=3142385 RepID=UPI00399F2FFD